MRACLPSSAGCSASWITVTWEWCCSWHRRWRGGRLFERKCLEGGNSDPAPLTCAERSSRFPEYVQEAEWRAFVFPAFLPDHPGTEEIGISHGAHSEDRRCWLHPIGIRRDLSQS